MTKPPEQLLLPLFSVVETLSPEQKKQLLKALSGETCPPVNEPKIAQLSDQAGKLLNTTIIQEQIGPR